MATLTTYEGDCGRDTISGTDALDEIFDLIEDLLSRLALNDPVRPCLAQLMPRCAAELVRPPVRIVS